MIGGGGGTVAGKTVLAMHDSPQFGGHEVMLLRFLPRLLAPRVDGRPG